MRALAPYGSLGAIDARSIARDSLLRWMILITPLFGLLLRLAVPPIADSLRSRFAFQLEPYYALIVSFLPLAVAGMIGTVVGFLLLDQRDDGTLTALLVTPLSLGDYLRYRLAVLLLASIALTSLALPLAGLRPTTPLQLAVTSIVAAPLAPLYAMFLGSFAANKVQGFALSKAVGIVMLPCIAAYFVVPPWQLAFGVLPQYWPLAVFWLFDRGAVGQALAHAAAGLAWQAVVLALLARRLARVLRQ